MVVDLDSYLLGVFDSEGSIYAGNNHGTWSPKVTLSITDERIVRLFQARWGGRVYQHSVTKSGRVLWNWQLYHSEVEPFFRFIAEHSLLKGEQAKLALAIRATINANRRRRTPEEIATRDELARQLSALNGARSRFGARFPQPITS